MSPGLVHSKENRPMPKKIEMTEDDFRAQAETDSLCSPGLIMRIAA